MHMNLPIGAWILRVCLSFIGLGLGSFVLDASAASNSRPTLFSFSPNTGHPMVPFTLLTINGKNFDPTAKVFVVFFDGDQGHGTPISVPALAVTPTSLKVSLPSTIAFPLKMRVKEQPVSGPQRLSNAVLGPVIAPVPTSHLPPGTYILTLLQAVLAADVNLQSELSGTALDQPKVQAALRKKIASLQSLIDDLRPVVEGSKPRLLIGTRDGARIYLTRKNLRAADGFVLSLVAGLAATPPSSQTTLGRKAANPQSPVQAAANDVIDADDLSSLNQKMSQLVSSIETYASDHADDLIYTTVIAGAFVAQAALVLSVPPTAAIVAEGLFASIGINELLAPVELFSLNALKNTTIPIASAICTAMKDGTGAGISDVATGFATDLYEKLVIGGNYVSSALGVLGAIDLAKCGASIIATPKPGIYAGTCTAASNTITCCNDGHCDTEDGASATSPPFSTPISDPSEFESQLCPGLLDVFNDNGCESSACNVQGASKKSFSLRASCQLAPVPSCTPSIATVTCKYQLED